MRNNLATWAGADEAAIKRGADRVVARPWEQKKTERDFKQQPAIKDARGVVYLRVRFVAVWFMALSETFAFLSKDTTVNKSFALGLRCFTEIRKSPTSCSLCVFDTNRKGEQSFSDYTCVTPRGRPVSDIRCGRVCPPPYAAVVMMCVCVCVGVYVYVLVFVLLCVVFAHLTLMLLEV